MKEHLLKGHWPKSEQDVIDEYKVNTDFRVANKLRHNERPTSMRRADWEITQIMNHQTEVIFVPKYWSMIPEWSVEIMEELLKVERPTRKAQEVKETWNLWGLMLTDLHLNQRDIHNNSFNKRVKIVNDRIARVMDRLLRFDPEKLLIPNLWDMNNNDVKHLTSSLKTPMQDNLSVWDWYKKLLEREITMLEGMQQYWIPLKYVRLWGNHDEFNSQLSAIALQYFFKDSDIEIGTTKNRYYEIRGNTMIALSHWDRWEWQKLFQMVVDECISKTRKKIDHMYAFLGHHHKKIIHQEWPLEIINLQAPAPKTEWCEKYWHDMKSSMSWFIFNKDEWKIVEVRW